MSEIDEAVTSIQRLIDDAKALDEPQTKDEAKQRLQNLFQEIIHIIMHSLVEDTVKKVLEQKVTELIVQGKLEQED